MPMALPFRNWIGREVVRGSASFTAGLLTGSLKSEQDASHHSTARHASYSAPDGLAPRYGGRWRYGRRSGRPSATTTGRLPSTLSGGWADDDSLIVVVPSFGPQLP